MRPSTMLAVVALCVAVGSNAAHADERFPEIVAHKGIAFSRVDSLNRLTAYDPVAAYDDHRTAVADCRRYETSFKGVTWCFESEGNKQKFEAAAKERVNQYVPFGGGYCARGLSNGNFAPGDPRTHVRAGNDLIVNGSWAVADDFFDDLSRRAAARVMYRLAQRNGLLVPNTSMPAR